MDLVRWTIPIVLARAWPPRDLHAEARARADYDGAAVLMERNVLDVPTVWRAGVVRLDRATGARDGVDEGARAVARAVCPAVLDDEARTVVPLGHDFVDDERLIAVSRRGLAGRGVGQH